MCIIFFAEKTRRKFLNNGKEEEVETKDHFCFIAGAVVAGVVEAVGGAALVLPLFLLLEPFSEAVVGIALFDFLLGLLLVVVFERLDSLISPLFPFPFVDVMGGEEGMLEGVAEGVDEAVVLEDISPWPLTLSSS